MDLVETPSNNGSSPMVEQPPLDLNMPTQDNKMVEPDPPVNLSRVSNVF
jgi:hypothetical protein